MLVLGKAAVGIFGYYYAHIAEAIESGTDVLSAGIAWLGLRTATRKFGENCLHGHSKAEPLVAIAVAVGLWSWPSRLTSPRA